MKMSSNRRRCFQAVTIFINKEHIGGICCSSSFVDEFKGVADIITILWVCVFSATLLQDKNKFISIL